MLHSRAPIDNRPPPARSLTRPGVTGQRRSPTLFGVPKSWPVEEFREYLLACMKRAQIPDFAELSRLTGVSQTQLSNWRYGKSQPSQGSLKKIAPVLGVAPVNLYIAAGVNDSEELELTQAPDLRVGPREFQDLAELWDDSRLTDEQRSFIRRSVATLVAGLQAELPNGSGPQKIRPSGGRHTA
jgi:transcriptional regulator with XRE-family HTH domain